VDDIRSWDDFARLPFLTKDEVRQAGNDLVAEAYRGPLVEVRTGGSTGQPLVYSCGPDFIAANLAAAWRSRRWHGIDIGDPYIHLWGHYRFLDPRSTRRERWIKRAQDKIMNRLWLCAYNMSEADLVSYVQRILSFKPAWGIGYASAFHRLAIFCKARGLSLPFSMKGIVLTSENCYEFQRELVEEVFNCPTMVEYGLTEVGIVAYECPHGQLHVIDENIYLETIPRKGLPDGTGEIVVTQLSNSATPLIRYRTGDIGTLSAKACTCGRNLTILEQLMGRDIDMLVTTEGRYVHGLYVIHIFDYLDNIREFQVVQKAMNSFDVLIVRENTNIPVDITFLRQRMREQFGDDIQVSILCVDHLPPEPSGKIRYVKSEVGQMEFGQ